MTSVPVPVLRRLVGLASRAPSVHNTQPWRWLAAGDRLELVADRSRSLPAADPDGRNLEISCGAALHHAQVAAAALGWPATVELLPEPSDADLLARLTLTRDEPRRDAGDVIESIQHRCTDRRRFTSWPVPDERLAHLAARAGERGVHAIPLTDPTARFRAELLINHAVDVQDAWSPASREQRAWVDHGAHDGIPSSVLPGFVAETPARRATRFAPGLLDDSAGREVEGSDGLIALCDAEDDTAARLRAGEGLSALWLAATAGGLSVVPLSQVVEVEETRDRMRREVLGGLAIPLIVVRVGWQAISRSDLKRTPRRPVDEVLEVLAVP